MSFVPDRLGSRIRLYSLILLGVPLLFTAVALIVFVRSSILDSSTRTLKEQAASHKVFIEEWFRERQNGVKFLAQLEEIRKGEKDKIAPIFNSFADTHPDISAVVMVGPDGKSYFDTTSNMVLDVSDREYFIQGRIGKPHVSQVIIGRTSGKAIIIFAHPVTRMDGTFGGVVVLPAQLTSINELMTNLHFGHTGETYIVDRDGFMLTKSRYEDDLKKQGRINLSAIMEIKVDSAILEAALDGQQPAGPYYDYRGAEVLGACQWTKNGSWLIVSEIDFDEAIGPLFPYLWSISGGFLVTLLLLSPLIIRLIRSIEVPLNTLSDLSLRMTRGDFDQTCSGLGLLQPPLEIRNLYDVFCAMQEKVDSTVQELEKSAITDQLTGLPNRRYLIREGSRLVNIAIRAGQPCTLFMMDVDHFKNVNDTYGHTVGDEVLRQAARVIREVIRTSDIVARFGGEEFAVVAPGSDLAAGHELAERIRHSVASTIFNTKETPLSCTISIGIAHYASHIRFGADAFEDMIARADKALYEAKAAGRNTVRMNEEQA